MKLLFNLFVITYWVISCQNDYKKKDIYFNADRQNYKSDKEIDLITDSLIIDGFDFPVGNKDGTGSYISLADGKKYYGWNIATTFTENYSLGIHTGIDINGSGGGNTDLGQPVFAIAKGIVVDAFDYGAPWGGVVVLRHSYLENGKLSICFSLYAHMEKLNVKKNEIVAKRKQLGEIGTGKGSFPAHLHLEIRNENMKNYASTYWPSSNGKDAEWIKKNYFDPYVFITHRRKLTAPFNEQRIIIAIKNKYKMYYFMKGKLVREYDIALSQNPIGPKLKQGDLKLPEGEYYICEKQQGPFYGEFSEFLGPKLLRISYPNIYDAVNGFKTGLINQAQQDKIIQANQQHNIPLKNTALGGGIVIHGWKGNWVANGSQNITWGCISMHNQDLGTFYDLIAVKTKILMLP